MPALQVSTPTRTVPTSSHRLLSLRSMARGRSMVLPSRNQWRIHKRLTRHNKFEIWHGGGGTAAEEEFGVVLDMDLPGQVESADEGEVVDVVYNGVLVEEVS